MADSIFEWVEMIEPQTHERMYANLVTGECVWQPPPGVNIKRAHHNQWWELYDKSTDRMYYYNVASQQTVWHRPLDADIIPLTKLQALKERAGEPINIRSFVRDEGTQTLTKQKHDQRPVRPLTVSATSPQLTSKHRHRPVHRGDSKSDRSADGSSAGSMSPVQYTPGVGALSSSGDIYGYVHHGGRSSSSSLSAHPQRSLEAQAPLRTCDILLDLERAALGTARPLIADAGVKPDLMSQSCQFQQMPPPPFRGGSGNGNVARATGSAEFDWKGNMDNPYSDLSDVMQAAQATPRPRTRAFPRTNPYVGTARADNYSTCRRSNDPHLLRHQTTYDVYTSQLKAYGGAGGGGGVVAVNVFGGGIGPATAVNPEYSTLRLQRTSASQSLDVADTSYFPEPGFSDRNAMLQQQSSQWSSEPFYVNVPAGGVKGSPRGRDGAHGIGVYDMAPLDRTIYDNAVGCGDASSDVFVDDRTADSSFGEMGGDYLAVQHDRELDRLSDLSIGSGVFAEPASNNTLGSAASSSSSASRIKPSPPLTSRNVAAAETPDLLYRAGIVGQKLAEADRLRRSESPVATERSRSVINERSIIVSSHELQRPLSENTVAPPNNSHGTPALARRFQYRSCDAPAKLYSESDGDAYVQELQQSSGSGDAEFHSISEFDLELFATTRLNEHRKGLLGRQLPIESLLTWTKNAIKKPIIRTANKVVKKEAPEVFRRIQMYMGDRPIPAAKSTVGSGAGGVGGASMSQLDIAAEVVCRAWADVELRDETYIQLCRQTTRNPNQDSLQLGLELMCICLAFFPPSTSFLPYLQLHLNSPLDNSIASVRHIVTCVKQSQRRLERILQSGAKRGPNRPTLDEVENALKSIYAPSMFGCTLSEIMLMQADRFPTRRLPWIQTTLSEEILRLNGICTEGIFRIPGDTDAVNALKAQCDSWNFSSSPTADPCVPASLLKLWYRELYEPLVPFELYEECNANCNDPERAAAIVDRMPAINRDVLKYLIRFLQVFAAPENVVMSKMDVNNLAMVMAPNCLRSRTSTPQSMLDNARYEMAFIRTLIMSLDTTDMAGVV